MKFGIGPQLNARIILVVVLTMSILVAYFSIQTYSRMRDDSSTIISNYANEMAATFEAYEGYQQGPFPFLLLKKI